MADRRLLVVDNEPDLCEIIRRVAIDLGYSVQITKCGKDFMRNFDDFDPTTVMLDIVMPKIDGMELIDWLDKKECNAKIFIATGSPAGHEKIAQAYAVAKGLEITVIEKPYRVATLRAALTSPIVQVHS
jgi:two-component system response regulator ResD